MISGDGREEASAPLRVAFCHLESLVCLPGINRLFAEFGDAIGLVILSDRFGSKHGGLLRQFIANVRRSGLALTLWLGFDIVAAQIGGWIGGRVLTLTSRRPQLASVRALAKIHGAAVLKVADVNDPDTAEALRQYGPDLVVVMNFDQILRQNFIAGVRGKVVNVHPSLLPALRGPCPVFWALVERRREVGVSLHLIEDEAIDSGPVLARRAQPVDPRQSIAEITSDLFKAGAALVPVVARALIAGGGRFEPQFAAHASYRSFPDHAEMARARAEGIRLCRLGYVARVFAASVGWGEGRNA
jgi:methionyl-tRNA formyltransferase